MSKNLLINGCTIGKGNVIELYLENVEKEEGIKKFLKVLENKKYHIPSVEEYLKDKIMISIVVNANLIGFILLEKVKYYGKFFEEGDYTLDYVIKKEYRGNKFDQNALKLLLEYKLKDQKRIVLVISPENIISRKCAKYCNLLNFRNYFFKEI